MEGKEDKIAGVGNQASVVLTEKVLLDHAIVHIQGLNATQILTWCMCV